MSEGTIINIFKLISWERKKQTKKKIKRWWKNKIIFLSIIEIINAIIGIFEVCSKLADDESNVVDSEIIDEIKSQII